MKKLKIKLFLKIFFILAFIEFLTALADVLLSQANSGFTTITSKLMLIFSLPISLISRDLPFYTNEGYTAAILFWIMNLIIQTTIVYGIIRVYKRIKKTY
ncbi:hypothetical protein H8K90_11105 [Winogradskyella echinorum]|uniref:Uncharacterized protein n=1 Tax=Winogradskyella echinorum TaxID=538189 RepID=A0ABR6Y2P3_9FLAO|nr:hypothetical protein [Winogradskyella echinorum]MBC3846929.1 hypothetical protein [Winogradskyella echinorum]MBC5751277.1 hypothetical protein [Winogradskyella echinorum]